MNYLRSLIKRLKSRFVNLNRLRDAAYSDAVAHGLWANESAYQSACLVEGEVLELMDASCDPHAFEEELADVIIMALSVAGHLDIDIHKAVTRKMAINVARPYMHEVIE